MWEQGDGEPFVVYEDSRYSARDFIADFLPSSEQPTEQEQTA
jgi:hypothetical protein